MSTQLQVVMGENKTERAIRLSASSPWPTYIVSATHKDAGRIFRRAVELGLEIPFPISFDEFLKGAFCGKNIKGFIVDDVDRLLRVLGRGVPIVALTVTEREEQP
jgi:hypothetical protein